MSLAVGHTNFSSPTDLGRTDIVENEIKLTDGPPFKEPYRNNPLAFYEKSDSI